MPNDGQSEAGPTGRPAAGAVDSVETLEDAVEIALGNAHALIGDADLHPVADAPGAHLDRRAGLAVLHGVLDQVADGRDELAAVTANQEPFGLRAVRFDRGERR